ncbi:GNAT family N-acetyltransferase [Clostridiaceae bacterium M8S5]|nr:GNAT family N-acetyltransferase [Clostridiaceae bacterium M8S5]
MNYDLNTYRTFKYTSFKYMDNEEIEEVLEEVNVLIAKEDTFFGYKLGNSNNKIHVYWASNDKESFIEGLNQVINEFKKTIYIEFIPPSFLPDMEQQGFRVVSEFMDFWNQDLKIQDILYKSNDIKVRPINNEEYALGSKITFACAGLSRGFDGMEVEKLTQWNESSTSDILVVEKNQKLVGIALVNLYGFDSEKGTCLWLRLIAVKPSEQNQGIGKLLLNHCINWGIERGAKRSFLHADVLNENAVGLYKKIGYVNHCERGQINMEKINR